MASVSAQSALWRGDCPRCGTNHTTFDVLAKVYKGKIDYLHRYECAMACRACRLPSIIDLEYLTIGSLPNFDTFSGKFINGTFRLVDVVTVIPAAATCPGHVPESVSSIFNEAARCLAIGAFDASGTMFRKVVDVVTRDMLPQQPASEDKSDPNWIAWKTRKDLRLRLDWLMENGLLSPALEPIVDSIREDGNDAAHHVIGIEEAQDLRDFTTSFLHYKFTLPGQIELNRTRRDIRRRKPTEIKPSGAEEGDG